MSYSYLSEIEAGRKTPSSRALNQIARALDVAPHELMEAAENMSQAPDESWFSPRHKFFQRSESSLHAFNSLLATQIGESKWSNDYLIEELTSAARLLNGEDVRRLIDLARRLRD
jgi:transcriptional regulator with XRE-family HTH domain